MKITAENNIITYVLSELRSFREYPLNEVDSVVFSWLSYLRLPEEMIPRTRDAGLPITELYRREYFEYMTERTMTKEDSILLLAAVCASPRFRETKIHFYHEELDALEAQQFAAMSFVPDPDRMYIAFRGTDSTLIGWKEDFNMVLDGPIPSQRDAVDYLNRIASRWDGSLLVGGHSKGGNLAVYSACCCEPAVQARILQVYSHDGPGFLPEEIETLNLDAIRSRLVKTLPQASLIGLLLCQECNAMIVRSNARGFAQHIPFSWIVQDGKFAIQDNLSHSSRILDSAVNDWVTALPMEDRKRVIDTIFQVLESTGDDNFQELSSHKKSSFHAMLDSALTLDEETKLFLLRVMRGLAASGFRATAGYDE